MGILAGLKRGVVRDEIKRLLSVYRPVLTKFGITVEDELLIEEVLRLYDAKAHG